jgi:hypothetical protein
MSQLRFLPGLQENGLVLVTLSHGLLWSAFESSERIKRFGRAAAV